MAEAQDLAGQATISPEGRVLIPAEFRRRLGLQPGDRVRLVLTPEGLSIVSARAMTHALWANNHGGDAGDAAQDVRRARVTDQQEADAKWERIAQADEAKEPENDLLRHLGLT